MGVRGQRSSKTPTSDERVEKTSGRGEGTKDNARENGAGGETGEGGVACEEEREGRGTECDRG